MNGFDKDTEKMDNTLLQKLTFIELSSWEWWTKFRFLQRNRKEGKRYFDKTRNEMRLASESSSPGTSCTLVQVQKRLGNFEKYPDDPEWNWNELAKQVTDLHLVLKQTIWKGCRHFRKGEPKRGGENMHFIVSEACSMMMAHISSASGFFFVFGICDYLGKINEIDLESRRNTASVVLTPRFSETASPSRASVADNLADYAWVAKEHFSARAPTVESDWFANRARAAEESLQWIPNQQTTEAFVEKTKVTSDK